MIIISKIKFQEIKPWPMQPLADILISDVNINDDVNANAGVCFLSILFNGTSVKTQISPELQFLLIYLRTTFTNYFWLFEVVWFCCLVERHDLLKSMTVYLIILYARI